MIVDMVKVVMGMKVYGSFSAMNIVTRTCWEKNHCTMRTNVVQDLKEILSTVKASMMVWV